ncbi:MAG: hypothetical protein ALAOOOJD_02129 [bacterium]|nr:hypothetical protein [bacterium]
MKLPRNCSSFRNKNSNAALLCCLLAILIIWGCAGSKTISTSDKPEMTATIAKSEAMVSIDKPEVMAWGNLNGIRVEGQLMEFKTSLRVVRSDWAKFDETGKERRGQRHHYMRSGKMQTVFSMMDSLFFKQAVEETEPRLATIAVQCSSRVDTNLAGIFYCIELSQADYRDGKIQLLDATPPTTSEFSLATMQPNEHREYLRTTARGARFISPRRQLEVKFAAPTAVIIREDSLKTNFQAYVTLVSGNVKIGQTVENTFTLKASGEVDKKAVELVLDPSRPGQVFDGFGGNFRLQNPKVDPSVIQYNLDHLRVAWSRVEMPWQFWQPDENVDPIAAARAGNIHPRVQAAMEMAQRLAQRGIPVIVSDWYAPAWAIIGDPRDAFRPQPGGLRGYPLNPEKLEKIYHSIGAYLLYLKQQYGVEAFAFSFNESDLGINVRQTAEEHAQFIKGLGAHLASIGLATKLLLGDTSDAWPIDFIKPAMQDLEAVKYINAVSFHSWRGCTDAILAQWHQAARELNVPLLVGEGSTDAAAWTYPQIFDESSFALHEINLYTRICALSQPKSILQWQLTSDYSLLAGGGVFGNDKEPLRPTQRFWNLKQLASTPPGAFALPVTCNSANITSAAFGDIARGHYAVHIVNTGATRTARLTGLPASVKELRVYVTDSAHGMQEGQRVPVVNGQAQFTLEASSFTTLMSVQ